MKRTIGLLILSLLFLPAVLFGESVWQGTASMGRYGEFPATGYYGASSSFPRNTMVEVEHIRSGKKVPVIIVDRLDNSELFILLSKEACEKIGISQEEVVPVRVKVSLQDSGGYSRFYGDLPYTPDPDINPAAGFDDLKEFLFEDIAAEETAGEEVMVLEEPPVEETAAEEVIVEEPETLEITEEEVPVLEEEPIMEQIVVAEPAESPVSTEEPFSLEPRIVIDEEEPAEEEVVDVLKSPGMDVESTIARMEETPTVSDLPDSPYEPTEVVLADLDIPAEIIEETEEEFEEPETPIVNNGSLTSPEEEMEIEVEEVDVPTEMIDFAAFSSDESEVAETEIPPETIEEKEEDPSFYEEEIAAFIPLSEDAELVLEPAEPRPPQDMIPDAVNGMPDSPDSGEKELAMTMDDLNIPEYEELKDEIAAAEPSIPETVIEETEAEEVSVEVVEELVAEPVTEAEEEAFPEIEVALAETVEEALPPFREEPVTILEKEAYYLQLGAFRKSASASKMAETFSPVYPVTVHETMINSNRVYKVLIGPLNTDESGSLLYTLKAKGYKDAFLRRGE